MNDATKITTETTEEERQWLKERLTGKTYRISGKIVHRLCEVYDV